MPLVINDSFKLKYRKIENKCLLSVCDILLNSYRFEKQKVREEKLWRDGRVLKDYMINNLKFNFSYKVAALPKYVFVLFY